MFVKAQTKSKRVGAYEASASSMSNTRSVTNTVTQGNGSPGQQGNVIVL